MDVIEIKRDWGALNRPSVSWFLNARFYGRWTHMKIILAALFAFGALGGVIEFYYPVAQRPNIWPSVMPMIIAIIVLLFLNQRLRKKLIFVLNNTPLRNNTKTIFLSAKGVSDFGPPHRNEMVWDYITDVVEYKDMVLLLISPIEYFSLPDSGLPDGLTRADLLEQIAKWRATAAP